MDEAITRMFGKVEQRVVDEMMSSTDSDGDGKIDVREFIVCSFSPASGLASPPLSSLFQHILCFSAENHAQREEVSWGNLHDDGRC